MTTTYETSQGTVTIGEDTVGAQGATDLCAKNNVQSETNGTGTATETTGVINNAE